MLVSGREVTKREWERFTTIKLFKRSMSDNSEGRYPSGETHIINLTVHCTFSNKMWGHGTVYSMKNKVMFKGVLRNNKQIKEDL